MKRTTILGILCAALGLYPAIGLQAAGAPTPEWLDLYDGVPFLDDYGRTVTTDVVGNVYVSGRSRDSATNYDIATVKYDASGATLWTARYDGTGSGREDARQIVIDPFGDVVVVGNTFAGGTRYNDIVILKYDSNGNFLWQNTYDGGNDNDAVTGVVTDAAGNIYITGLSAAPGAHFDCVTQKYSPAGALLWTARYNGPGSHFDSGRAIALDTAGNVVVTGFSAQAPWTNYDVLTIKYDTNGNQLWLERYNGPADSDDFGWNIYLNALDEVYVSGSATMPGTGRDLLLAKYSPGGTLLNTATYSGPGAGDDHAYNMGGDSAGNVYATGRSRDAGNVYDFITVGYTPAGSQLWAQRYDGPGAGGDEAYGLAVDQSGNVYVSGVSLGAGGSFDAAMVGYDPAGTQLSVSRYDGPVSGSDIGFRLAIDLLQNIYMVGRAQIGPADYAYLTIKYKLPMAAAEQVEALTTYVEAQDLTEGDTTSLTSKLDGAASSIEDDRTRPAVGQMGSFINEVDAREGKTINATEADTMTTAAEDIIDELQ